MIMIGSHLSHCLKSDIRTPQHELTLRQPCVAALDLDFTVQARLLPRFDRPIDVTTRTTTLLTRPPWIRSLGRLSLDVTTQGWRFPDPNELLSLGAKRGQSPLEHTS